MDDYQSPEEKGKQILAQQAQEQMQLQAQAEEEEREEAVKLRRLKERRLLAFLTYLKKLMDEEKLRQEYETFMSKLQEDFLHEQLEQAQANNQLLLHNLARHDAAVSEFLFADESKETMDRRNDLLQQVDMDQSDFSALAMAELSKKPENNEDVEKVFTGNPPSEKLTTLRKDSIRHADEALTEFSTGNIRKMEMILKGGLINACHAFSQTKDPLHAIHWSKQINGILSVVSSHPVLFKDGVNTPMLEAAAGMAALGRVMENGLQALDALHAAQLGGVQLPAEKEKNLQAQVLLMQQTDAQRGNEEYQKFFSKGYHPRTGLQQDNLKKLLQQLNSSQAMHTLSTMKKSDKLFVLSDTESRKTLSESLFVPYVEKKSAPEKKTTAAGKKNDKKVPGLSY